MPNHNYLSKKEYDYIYDRVPRLCVDIVIKGNLGIILAWRTISPQKNTWHLPGGRVRIGETLAQAAKRIARDEVGAKIEILKTLGFLDLTKERQYGHRRHSVSIVLLAHFVGTCMPQTQKWETEHVAQSRFFKKRLNHMHKSQGAFLQKLGLLTATKS